MFYSISRLMQDFHNATLGFTNTKQDQPSLGSVEAIKKKARINIAVQLTVSVIIIGLCVYISNWPDVSAGIKRLSYIGMGAVLGYWLR